MATSSSFFTLRRGSTKSLTFQIYRGKQVTKDRVQSVANPQTEAQMLQRIKLAGIMQTRSTLKPILNHAFEGVEYGEPSLEEFVRLNLQNKNSQVVFTSYGTSKTPNTSIASFQISKGSLAPATCEINESQLIGRAIEGYTPFTTAPSTVDGIVDEIYKMLGADDDYQISFIYALPTGSVYTVTVNGTTKTLPILKWRVARLKKGDDSIMNAWSFAAASGSDTEDAITDGQTRLSVSILADGSIFLTTGNADGSTHRYIFMGTIVLSKPDGNNWKRSTQYLASWPYEEALTADEAIWLLTTDATSTLYLNAGGSGSTEMVPSVSE